MKELTSGVLDLFVITPMARRKLGLAPVSGTRKTGLRPWPEPLAFRVAWALSLFSMVRSCCLAGSER